MARKNGPPTSAVTMPTGISTGATTVRPTASHATRNVPPAITENGPSVRGFGPNTSRPTWGTTRPTNPIGPHVATTPPTMSDAAANINFFTVVTDTPRDAAASS